MKKSVKKVKKVVVNILIMGVFLIMCMLSACTSGENKTGINIVTTNFPAYDFARQIAGDKANIEMLIKPGSDVHLYEPSPQDIMKINESDIFIFVGGENDSWLDGIIDSIENDKLIMIKMMDCVTIYEEEYVDGMQKEEHNEKDDQADADDKEEHKSDAEHDHSEWDEHVWTSPINALKICSEIKNKLIDIDSDNVEYYNVRYSEYEKKLKELDSAFKSVINSASRNVLIFADRFPVRYFVEEYGLEYFAAFPGCSSDTEASASTIAFLIDKVKSENITTILKIELSKGNIAKTIQEETGAEIMTFYACHNLSKDDFENGKTYLDFMWENLKTLEKALG